MRYDRPTGPTLGCTVSLYHCMVWYGRQVVRKLRAPTVRRFLYNSDIQRFRLLSKAHAHMFFCLFSEGNLRAFVLERGLCEGLGGIERAEKAEAEKQEKYHRSCARMGCEFEPMVLSTWGRGTPEAESLLRKIHKKGHPDLQHRQAESYQEFRGSLGMRLALRVAAQLEQAPRLAVARNDATLDECETDPRYGGRPGKRLTGCTPESPRAAKRPSGVPPVPPPRRAPPPPRAHTIPAAAL